MKMGDEERNDQAVADLMELYALPECEALFIDFGRLLAPAVLAVGTKRLEIVVVANRDPSASQPDVAVIVTTHEKAASMMSREAAVHDRSTE